MNTELLEIARQFKSDCEKEPRRLINYFHYFLVKTDGSVEYRKTMPYIVTHADTLVIVNEYGFQAVAYYSGNDYTAYKSKCLCLSDNGDSESFSIGDWSLTFDGLNFIWNEGDWPRLKLTKEGFEYLLLFQNYDSVAKNWDIVKLFMEAEGPKHLELLLKQYTDKGEIKRWEGKYKIMK